MLDQTQWYSRLLLGLHLEFTLSGALGNHIQCEGLNWVHPHAMQAPYLLYYLSGPGNRNPYVENKKE